MFYENGTYLYLGEIPTLPVVKTKTSDQMASAQLYFSTEYGNGAVTKNNFRESVKGLVYKAMDAIMNGYTDRDGKIHEGQGLHLFDGCFIRYAFRLYDGSLVKHSPPILILPTKEVCEINKSTAPLHNSIKSISYVFDGDTLNGNYSWVYVYGYKIRIYYDFSFSGWEKWSDIIKSVDVFMSPPIGLSNIENMRNDMPTISGAYNLNLIKGINKEAVDSLKNMSTFYFIKSIPLGNSGNWESLLTDTSIGGIENIIYQELMSDDNFSNHKIGAETSFCYNNRLHLANIRTTFFEGFNPDFFVWNNTSTIEEEWALLPLPNYNGHIYALTNGSSYNALMIEVEINTGAKTEKKYCGVGSIGSKLFMSSYISYPDPRATRFAIYRQTSNSWYKIYSGQFQKHNFLNLAYHVSEELSPICEKTSIYVSSLQTSTVVSLQEPNKIKVSDLNNPLRFPNKNTYQVGNGRILALATNAMNVADRNYGQFPLYVFTSQGIWTMNVGEGEVVYSVLSTPTYQESPINDVVCPTPYGVVFIAPKGLMLINGQSVEYLSPQLKQAALPFSIEIPEEVKDLIHLPDDLSFEEYLKKVDNIAYNPHESEIIISDREHKYDYVYTLSQQYFKSTEKFNQVVKNYPSGLLVVDQGNRIRDYLESGDNAASVSFILRPLTFGTNEIKRLERMILRGNMYNACLPFATDIVLMTHHSNDNNFFRLTRGMKKGPADYRDIDLGLFARSKWRQFVVSFGGVIEEQSQIFNIDTMIENEYTNTKMR